MNTFGNLNHRNTRKKGKAIEKEQKCRKKERGNKNSMNVKNEDFKETREWRNVELEQGIKNNKRKTKEKNRKKRK